MALASEASGLEVVRVGSGIGMSCLQAWAPAVSPQWACELFSVRSCMPGEGIRRVSCPQLLWRRLLCMKGAAGSSPIQVGSDTVTVMMLGH